MWPAHRRPRRLSHSIRVARALRSADIGASSMAFAMDRFALGNQARSQFRIGLTVGWTPSLVTSTANTLSTIANRLSDATSQPATSRACSASGREGEIPSPVPT